MTGHRGFIGKNLKSYIEQKGHVVVPYEENLLSWGSFRDKPAFEEFKDCDLIIHLAGKNKGTDKEIITTNVFATGNLLEWCKNYNKRIFLAGTDYKIDGAYKHSKDTAKALCRAYGFAGVLNSITFNFPKVIGPGCKPHYNSFATTLICSAACGSLNFEKKSIKDPNEIVELIHVEDACQEILICIDKPHNGFLEYEYTKYDGKFSITLGHLVEILEGKPSIHPEAEMILKLRDWYKENFYGKSE